MYVRLYACTHVCVWGGPIARGNIQGRRTSEIYLSIKLFSPQPSCSSLTQTRTYPHTRTCTLLHGTYTTLTIHLSTFFYSFYQEYCCYTFQAFPGFLVCRSQRGKTSQPYLFTSKNSFIIIIIFQSWFIIIADGFFLIFLTILKRRTWHLLQVFSKTFSCSLRCRMLVNHWKLDRETS